MAAASGAASPVEFDKEPARSDAEHATLLNSTPITSNERQIMN
jgi:hypothetical protein